MAQYIPKDALVADIEKNLRFIPEHVTAFAEGEEHAYHKILSFLDTLEVKEVDVNKEIDNYLLTYWNEEREKFLHPFLKKMCVHFFELGITASNKIQKGK